MDNFNPTRPTQIRQQKGGVDKGPAVRKPSRHLFRLAALTLLASLILGVGSWRTADQDLILQIISLILIASALSGLSVRELSGFGKAGFVIAFALTFLPWLQLIEMPPSLWRQLPGHEGFFHDFIEMGIAPPWMPLSLDPAATRVAAFSIAPGLALYFATIQLDQNDIKRLAWLIIIFAFVSAVMALGQSGHTGSGLFVNRNHLATLLCMAMPFTAALAAGALADGRPRSPIKTLLLPLILISLMLSVSATGSRFGLLLTVLAAVSCVALTWAGLGRKPAQLRVVIGIAIVLGLFLIPIYGLREILTQLELGLRGEYRITIANYSYRAALDFLPFGSGFGTFIPVYQLYEPITEIRHVYANTAHNDWLQLLLEGGIPALVISFTFLIWLLKALLNTWSKCERERSSIDVLFQRAATIAIVIALVHSFVDYPLRTGALMAVFGYAAGVATPRVTKRK